MSCMRASSWMWRARPEPAGAGLTEARQMHKPPLKLMIPGPIQPADEVLRAMGGPVHPHYGVEWNALHTETLDMLRQVYAPEATS